MVPPILSVFWLCVIAGLWLTLSGPPQQSWRSATSVPEPRPVSQEQAKQAIPQDEVMTYRGNYTHVAGFAFADEDLALYRRLYAWQEAGEWEKVNRHVRALSDPVLVPDLLAQRFLHRDYRSSYRELKAWLTRYGDHPDAMRIYELALGKKPARAERPPKPATARSLRGHGIRDGMGGRSMPRNFHTGLNAWQQGDDDKALSVFERIGRSDRYTSWQRSSGHFWAWRASKRLGLHSKAEYHLQEAAQYPFTFYGALAAGKLTPQLYQPAFATVGKPLMDHPAVRRAAAFAGLERADKAEEELRHLYHRLEPRQRRELVTITAALDLPGLQLRMSQMLHDDPEQSDITAYPTPGWIPHYDMVVDPALVYAIIRQESAFHVSARSPAGARGAMQIMPATADYMIDHYRLNEVTLASLDFTTYGKRRITRADLNRPDVNVMIGQHYIRYLSEKPYIQGNLIYLLAAYNAGPGNLLKWQKRFGQIDDPLLFMEKVPFKETRHYIKQVMANYLVYQSLIYGAPQSAQALRRNDWPSLGRPEHYAGNRARDFAQAQ